MSTPCEDYDAQRPLLARQGSTTRHQQVQEQQLQQQQQQQQQPVVTPTQLSVGGIPMSDASHTQLLIEASVATFPIATGHPVAFVTGNGSLLFLPDLPNVLQLWAEQRTSMLVWLLSSVLSLVLFSPFFFTSGLFLAAEVAAILSIMASGLFVCGRRGTSNGLELAGQIKLAATCGAAACVLDGLTAFLDLVIVWSVDCSDQVDDYCASIMNWAVVFGIYLTWHAYISLAVATRARALLPMLNPVSSGVVQL